MNGAALRRVGAFALTILGGFGALKAFSADNPPTAQALRARALAATCAACHGTDGRPHEGSTMPGQAALAGQPASALVEQMKAFRSGARPGSVMPQLARGYSDAQIEQLAAWFSKANP